MTILHLWLSIGTVFAKEWNFIQTSDLHWDPLYSVTNPNKYCHNIPSGDANGTMPYRETLPIYGQVGSFCDTPTSLINKTFEFLQTVSQTNAIFVTGDFARYVLLIRHDRDDTFPRTSAEIVSAIDGIIQRFTSLNTTVIPAIGNWDTHLISHASVSDYTAIYDLWKPLWKPEDQKRIYNDFMAGGYYSIEVDNITVVSMNTLDWFVENPLLQDCQSQGHHPGDIQLDWLASLLSSLKEHGKKAILIGHVPPVTYANVDLYRKTCMNRFKETIGLFSDVILAMYFGHVNRDLAYLTVKTETDFDIYPIAGNLLKEKPPGEIVGVFYTGPSIVPYFNPGIRLGTVVVGENGTYVAGHVQYYSNLTEQNQIDLYDNSSFFQKDCSTSKSFSMNSLSPSAWDNFLTRIHKGNKRSLELMKKYKKCSTIHVRDEIEKGFERKARDLVLYFVILGSMLFAYLIYFACAGTKNEHPHRSSYVAIN